mmetsp:Transcript_8825/g.27383  ORF Transcript_8825/g.27383 Transcript_8825/m.27383 type:complete len:292 (+) Transcript_8825:2006-2881(+)
MSHASSAAAGTITASASTCTPAPRLAPSARSSVARRRTERCALPLTLPPPSANSMRKLTMGAGDSARISSRAASTAAGAATGVCPRASHTSMPFSWQRDSDGGSVPSPSARRCSATAATKAAGAAGPITQSTSRAPPISKALPAFPPMQASIASPYAAASGGRRSSTCSSIASSAARQSPARHTAFMSCARHSPLTALRPPSIWYSRAASSAPCASRSYSAATSSASSPSALRRTPIALQAVSTRRARRQTPRLRARATSRNAVLSDARTLFVALGHVPPALAAFTTSQQR